jgi:hydrogenase expression/formation protein HypE
MGIQVIDESGRWVQLNYKNKMSDQNVIRLAHGGGGKATRDLIGDIFIPILGNPLLDPLDDSAILRHAGNLLAFTTDTFVVKPLFFPGGDIGKLAVCGTVNDLAAVGANPLALSLALILEEGFSLDDLRSILSSIKRAADEAGVPVATGDTKVVEKGHCDGLFINTSGVGVFAGGHSISGSGAVPGDSILVNGPLGRHGLAVVTSRAELGFSDRIKSDVAPLNGLVRSVLEAVPDIHAMRDATRGGLAAALNEIAEQSGVGIELDETAIPVDEDVRGVCEILGFDPISVANEGVMVFAVPETDARRALEAMAASAYGKSCAFVGRVTDGPRGRVHSRTPLGSRRIVGMPTGEQLPRIC